MEQTSCLCSVISLKYIHILHNNLHVTSYSYKLSYEFKKLLNAKMLALMDHIYSECTYSVCVCVIVYVCVFHVASDDQMQRNVH